MAIDLENGYEELREHVGHVVEIVAYGPQGQPLHAALNVAVQCVTCGEILIDFDAP